jgi:hypothetical protein
VSHRLAAAHILIFFPDVNAHNCQSTFTIAFTYLYIQKKFSVDNQSTSSSQKILSVSICPAEDPTSQNQIMNHDELPRWQRPYATLEKFMVELSSEKGCSGLEDNKSS